MNALTAAGEAIIKGAEGCRLTAYQDSVGVFSIGYGHTHNVTADTAPVTNEQAEMLFKGDAALAGQMVAQYIFVPLNDNQYSALVSLCFNEGSAPLTKTLGALLNAGNYEGAANEFPKWVYAGGIRLNGLIARRAAERALFLTPCNPETSSV